MRRIAGTAVAAALLAAGTAIAAPAPADTLDHRSDLLGHNRLPAPIAPADTVDVASTGSVDAADGAVAADAGVVAAPGGAVAEDAPVAEPGIEDLRGRHLVLPVEGMDPASLNDGFLSRRGRRLHHGIDIMAPRETPIYAVDDGVIARLDARSRAGGITIYQIDATGTYGYYYAHLERWAEGLQAGDTVTRGQTIGYVGSTGNAPERSPHLHFAIHRLGPSRQPWVGSPLNPYLVFLP